MRVNYLRPLLCAEEYLHAIPRWCLWLVNAPPSDVRGIHGIKQRVESVREFRLASKKEPTRRKADTPSLFAEIRQPSERYVVIPQHTSESRIETAAQTVLDVRAVHQAKGATLADLYDPVAMPPDLVKAHAALDRAVDLCYRPQPFTSERQRVEYLFALYEKLTAPLAAATKPAARRRRAPALPLG